MDVTELAKLYRQAHQARNESVRQILANAVAQAAAAQTVLAEAKTARVGKKGVTDGPHVRRLQLLLAQHGADLRIDGKFGAKTEKALKEFQKRNDLPADGVGSPKTWDRLLGAAAQSEVGAALAAKATAELDAFHKLSATAVRRGDTAAAEALAAEAVAAEALAAEALASETLAAEASDRRFSAEPLAVEAAVAESATAEGVTAVSAALETFVTEATQPRG